MKAFVSDTAKYAIYEGLAWSFAVVGIAVTRVLGIGRRRAGIAA